MGIHVVAAGVATVALVGIGVYLYYLWYESSDVQQSNETSGFVRYGNPNNNHDHEKQRHDSREDAEREASRMHHRFPDNTFNAYFNRELGSWFVGRSQFDRC